MFPNQVNRPVQEDTNNNNNNNNQAESLLSQMISQFLKNEFQSDSQNKIVNQGAPQSFNSIPGNVQVKNYT